MKYYNNRDFFVPHCKPARKATPKMDISTDTGRSTSNPVESANDCITKSFFVTPPSTLKNNILY